MVDMKDNEQMRDLVKNFTCSFNENILKIVLEYSKNKVAFSKANPQAKVLQCISNDKDNKLREIFEILKDNIIRDHGEYVAPAALLVDKSMYSFIESCQFFEHSAHANELPDTNSIRGYYQFQDSARIPIFKVSMPFLCVCGNSEFSELGTMIAVVTPLKYEDDLACPMQLQFPLDISRTYNIVVKEPPRISVVTSEIVNKVSEEVIAKILNCNSISELTSIFNTHGVDLNNAELIMQTCFNEYLSKLDVSKLDCSDIAELMYDSPLKRCTVMPNAT